MIRPLHRLLGAASGALVALACNADRAIVTEPLAAAYNFPFATVGTNIPRGTVTHRNATSATPDSLIVRLAGLEELATGVYQVFLGTQTTASAAPASYVAATGTLRIIETDTTIVNDDPVPDPDTTIVAGTSSFTAGGPRTRIELVIDQASLGQNPAPFNLVLVTIEPAAATAPGADSPKPLWARLFGLTTNMRDASVAFGNFDPNPANEYRYGIGGRGTLSAWGDILVIDDSALALPPKGYYYATAVIRDLTEGGIRDTIDLGPQKAPYPRRNVSLRDADINPNLDPVVAEVPPAILAAGDRIKLDTLNAIAVPEQPFRLYRNVWVTLEAKAGIADVSPSVILTSTFPDIVSKPPAD